MTPKEEPFKRKKIREDFTFSIFAIFVFIPFVILFLLVVIHTEIEERYNKLRGIKEEYICFDGPECVTSNHLPDQK